MRYVCYVYTSNGIRTNSVSIYVYITYCNDYIRIHVLYEYNICLLSVSDAEEHTNII